MKRIEAQRAVDLVAQEIRAAILGGEHAVGSRLPPERELAERMGVNRLTLRAALARLESEGLVRPRQGDGVRVLDFVKTAGIELVVHLDGGDPRLVRGFLELRRAVAAEAMGLAAARASAEDIGRLEALALIQQGEADPQVFAERDLEFGRAILEIAANLPMLLLLNTVERIYRAHPPLIAALHADRQAVRRSYLGAVALLKMRDADLARREMRAALELIDARALESLEKARAPKKRERAKPRSKRPA